MTLIVGEFYTRKTTGTKLKLIHDRGERSHSARYIFVFADNNQAIVELNQPEEVRPFGSPEVNWDLFGNWERFLVLTHNGNWVVSDTPPLLVENAEKKPVWRLAGFYVVVHPSQKPNYNGCYTSSLCTRYPALHPIPQEGDTL